MKRAAKKIEGKWVPYLIILLIGLFYFINLPAAYDYDGTVFSQYLRYSLAKSDLAAVSNPHHPWYMSVNYYLYKGLRSLFGYNAMEYFHLQLFSLLFGLLTLWVVYKIILSLTGQRFAAVVGPAIIAFSYGHWYYSVEAEVHMPGVFFAVLGMYLLFFKPGKGEGVARELGAALCFALSAAFHLTNGLAAAAVGMIFFIERGGAAPPPSWGRGKPLRFFFIYLVFLAGMMGVFVLVTGTNLFQVYREQLFGADAMAGYKISYWTALSPRSFWESVQSVAHGVFVRESSALIVLGFVFLFVGGLFIIWRGVRSPHKVIYRRLGFWMLPYFLFFTFWDHRNPEFKLQVVLPFLILFIVSAASLRGRVRNILLVMTACLVLCVNAYFWALPAEDIDNNQNYRVAEAVRKTTPAGSIIVIGGCGSDLSVHNKIYLSYFAVRRTFILDWMLGKGVSLEDLHTRILAERDKGTPVYLFSEITRESETVRKLLETHKLRSIDYFTFIRELNAVKKVPLPGGYYLARID